MMPAWIEPASFGAGLVVVLIVAAVILDSRRSKGDADLHERVDKVIDKFASKDDVRRVETQMREGMAELGGKLDAYNIATTQRLDAIIRDRKVDR